MRGKLSKFPPSLIAVVLGCGSDPVEPAFPADYAASYLEVRDCRSSADHDLNKIRIVADPAAMPAYVARTPFPVGAIVLKEEYDFVDDSCNGAIKQWTVMVKVDDDTNLGWSWQRVDASRAVTGEDESRCIGCHTDCGRPPDGFEGTCAVP